jgi:oligopeptide transport system ATP-binding protein
MAAPLLGVRDLAVHFSAGRGLFGHGTSVIRAVDGVSFDLDAGETLGVVGESGCGKSTLGRAILRLVRPSAGKIDWRGQDFLGLDSATLRRMRRDLQIIFQDPLASLDPRMNVGAIIARPLRTYHPKMIRTEIEARVHEALIEVGLSPDMVMRYPHEFSGGQCQRIGIARAIILRPRLVVCDEPVSALDVSIQAQIINLLRRLQAELGLAMLFISHNLVAVRHISHRVMVLYLGRVMEIAPRDAFYAEPKHPYSKALISAIPLPDPRRERARERMLLHGDLPSPFDPPKGCRFCTRCPMVQEICHRIEPPLTERGNGRQVACHFV